MTLNQKCILNTFFYSLELCGIQGSNVHKYLATKWTVYFLNTSTAYVEKTLKYLLEKHIIYFLDGISRKY